MDNIEGLKEQLTRKTQECETLLSQLDFEVQKKECLEHECEEALKQLEFVRTHNTVLCSEIDQLKLQKQQAEQKLKKIKDRCNETLKLMNKDSDANAYAGCRCTEAGQILHIIDEVENG